MSNSTVITAGLAAKVGALVLACATGFAGYGALRSDVSHLKEQQDRDTAVHTEDHDRLVRMESSQGDMKSDIGDIKQSVKELAKK